MSSQPKPDFSGVYVLNLAASTLSPGADKVTSAVVRFEHREPAVRCHGKFSFGDQAFEFTVDRQTGGREVVTQEGRTTVSTVNWDGDVLVFLNETTGPDFAMVMSWRYELLEGGRRLRAVERMRGSEHEQDNTWVFERQS